MRAWSFELLHKLHLSHLLLLWNGWIWRSDHCDHSTTGNQNCAQRKQARQNKPVLDTVCVKYPFKHNRYPWEAKRVISGGGEVVQVPLWFTLTAGRTKCLQLRKIVKRQQSSWTVVCWHWRQMWGIPCHHVESHILYQCVWRIIPKYCMCDLEIINRRRWRRRRCSKECYCLDTQFPV